jgi:PAS domain S-box-containing protein
MFDREPEEMLSCRPDGEGMEGERLVLSLKDLEPGDSVCLIFRNDEEHRAVITAFLRQGLERNEKVVYRTFCHPAETILGYLETDGFGVAPYLSRGQLVIRAAGPQEARPQSFDPKDDIEALSADVETALREGYSGLRFSSEEAPPARAEEEDNLERYDALLQGLLRRARCIVCCQYDQRRCEPGVLIHALRRHPIVSVGAEVFENPYCIPSDPPLRESPPATALQYLLRQVEGRKRLRNAWQESEERFRALIDSMPVPLIAATAEPRITHVSRRLVEVHGVDPTEELIGTNPLDLVVPEERDRVWAENRRVLTSGQTETIECNMLRRDGTTFPVLLSVAQLRDVRGNLQGTIGSALDISARKATEKALRESEAYLRTVMECLPFDMFVADANGRYVMQNSVCRSCWGDIIGRHPADIAQDGEALALWESNNRRALAGEVVEGEVCLKVQGQIRLFRNIISPVRDGDEIRGIVGVNIDITKRKETEEQLLSYQKQLRSLAEEVSTVEERERRRLASTVHDVICQGLAAAQMKLKTTAKSRDVDRMTKVLQELSDVVEQLIKDSRSLMHDLSPPILYELGFEAAVEWLSEKIQADYGLVTCVFADEEEKPLESHVRNVLFYAVREVLLNVVKHAQTDEVEVSITREGEQIRIDVIDDGIGFEWTATSFLADGTGGFGLFNIRERLDYLGGSVEVQSRVGHGCTVVLRAPLAHGT